VLCGLKVLSKSQNDERGCAGSLESSSIGIIIIEKSCRFFEKFKIILINLSVITSIHFWFSCLIMNKSWLSVAYYIIKIYKVTLLGFPKVNLESHYLPNGLLIAIVIIIIFFRKS